MSDLKDCKDCRHYDGRGIIEWCLRNERGLGLHGTAWMCRGDPDRCGPDGRWFEQKLPWWRRWMR